MKKRIIVVGGGFSGLSFLSKIYKLGLSAEITLVDKKPNFDFLPLMPDIIGRGLTPKFLEFDLRKAASGFKSEFINSSTERIDYDLKSVYLSNGKVLFYDYLVVASGSETNFYDKAYLKNEVLIIDKTADLTIVLKALTLHNFDNVLVVGAGYTGVEIASNLWRYFFKHKLSKSIILLEKGDSILGVLPVWMRNYALDNLLKMGVKIICNDSLESFHQGKVKLLSGKLLENSLVIWVPGVRMVDFVSKSDILKVSQGRIKVDEYLRFKDDCFAIGDSCGFLWNNNTLRMGVQNSIDQGRVAAINISRLIKSKTLIKYKPKDLGYILPLANNAGCGLVLGAKVKGRLALFFHYLMCLYRTYGMRNRWGVLKDLLKL